MKKRASDQRVGRHERASDLGCLCLQEANSDSGAHAAGDAASYQLHRRRTLLQPQVSVGQLCAELFNQSFGGPPVDYHILVVAPGPH